MVSQYRGQDSLSLMPLDPRELLSAKCKMYYYLYTYITLHNTYIFYIYSITSSVINKQQPTAGHGPALRVLVATRFII